MCRLFGMTGGAEPVSASFWLLDAPDGLSVQSHRDPDGTGLGVFDALGNPEVAKWPIAAYEDREFADEARHVTSTTFIAHIRHASTGAIETKNTHPFEQHGRVFAHNGIVEDLDRLEGALGEFRALVQGDTDSERIFALITKYIAAADGDVGAGISAACEWVAAHLPLYALNIVLATAHELWALRYPETHGLYVLERKNGGHRGGRHLDILSTAIRVWSHHFSNRPAVVIASEPMDDDPAWRLLEPGELLRVGPDMTVDSAVVIDRAPEQLLKLSDLHLEAARSQHPAGGTGDDPVV